MYQKSFRSKGRSSGGSRSFSDRPVSSHGGGSRFSRGGHFNVRGSRGSFGGGRNFRGGARRSFQGGRGRMGGGLDISRFINKAVITEKAEHFVPEHAFADFAIDARLKNAIAKKGYSAPTPIQDRIIPHILRGEDVVGIANTGTGKTGAFLIPLINKTLQNSKENILIIVPTRELALQIEQEFREFSRGMNLFSVSCVGGAYIGKQIKELRYKNNFIIGTPGRLKDLVERKCLNLANFSTLVLDEADRMLDMGFINDMKYVISLMPPVRHTLFFSATISRDIERLIKDFLKDPVSISVKTRETPKSVDQDVIHLKPGEDKADVLHNLLAQPEFNKVLVFGRTKHGVEKLSVNLVKRGFKAASIHGNKNQSQRQRALKAFKDNQAQVLVATDVAARGLDIPDVSHVINYDMPSTHDDYIHRIGRTGRGNKKGKALTFIEHGR